jgi:hypothetical protein
MSRNTELVQALEQILKNSDIVLKLLASENVNESNYKQFAYNTDSTSGCVIEGLFELREFIEEAIEQFDI